MWAYLGFESATIPAEDVIEPERTIPRALVVGTLTVTGVYILSTMGVMALIPSSALVESASPFSDAGEWLFGPWGAKFVAIGALVSIVGANNSNTLQCGLIPFAAARDGLFPARFNQVNASGAPAFSLVVSAGLASLLIVLNYARGLVAAFEFLLLLATLTALIPYAASAASDWVLQRRATQHEGQGMKKSPALIAVVAFVFSLFAIVGAGLEVVGYGLMLLVAGLPVYFWSKKAT
jgi:APA family basic amino acid/polyamine antiporter